MTARSAAARVERRFYWNYFFQFGSLGVFLPYFSLFLKHLGFSGTQISTIVLSVPVVQLFANPMYGWIADRRLPRSLLYRGALVCVLLLVGGFHVVRGHAAFVAFVAAYAFFRLPNISILNAALLERLAGDASRFGTIRLGGSVGFVVFTLLSAAWVEWFGIERIPDMLILAVAGHLVVGWTTPVDRQHDATPAAAKGRLGAILRSGIWWWFLAGVFFSRAAEAGYNIFYSLHLADLGFSRLQVGAAWTVAVCSEMFFLWFSPRLLGRWRLETVLLASYGIAAGRWLGTAVLTGWWPLLLLQATHGITFGLFYVAAVQWAGRHAPEGLTTTAQSVTNAVMFGLAGIAGMLGGGPLYDAGGGRLVFEIAAACGALAVCCGIVERYTERRGRPDVAPIG